ncbi:RICIN domain-containing protein [Microbispora triticiradicis]|uniref:Beta-galactosidase n=2 Tax=Microbispora TaxID=2005 RepID=A0ABY3LTY8_9ACTN|nr:MULTISPECIES: RICIN domain-containing protein [Microbispora]TLP52172.1 beta-galactosidase [Microbispora fusca]TYB54447.1 beta-galactosidase [Microbispora tritici]
MKRSDPSSRPRRPVSRWPAVLAVFLVAMIGAQPAVAAQQSAPSESSATVAAAGDIDGFTAGNAAIASVDLAGTWSFTPAGRSTTSIKVPGGGWYKQGFTDVSQAVYSRTVTVPDSGQPQSTWIEFGAVNHQATLSVDGRVVATQTTAFTPSKFDISAYAAPGTTHTITVDVKGRGALKNPANGKYIVPVAADWSEAVPQGIFRSAFLRVYPAVYVSDAFIRTSVANQTLGYDVWVTNTSSSARSVTVTGELSSDGGGTFGYPALPARTVTVGARSTAKVTVDSVAWNLGSTSYWWPNVPYRSGYRAQLHRLKVSAATDDGRTSDATYRFGFRETTQNGEYYYINGVRVNFRGDNLQGADYDRVDNAGKGDAYDTLPGFLPPSAGNGGWPQAVDNYQRLNYNVVRIHQEPASPYMLDVADETGLMIIDETGIRGSAQDFVSGHDNMVAHARALTLRDRNHPAVIRWSQANEPTFGNDSEQFEQDLYAAMNGNDGTRPVSLDAAPGADAPSRYPNMRYGNFAVFAHYLDGVGQYGERVATVTGRPDGEGEYVWNKCNTKQGFMWFATATAAKRGKDAADLRPYTLLSAWAGFVPGVRSTDFVPEEGGHPLYGADNLSDPWSNPQIQRVQAAFNPVAAIDLPYWSASGASDGNGTFPLPQAVNTYASNASVTRDITVFNDDLRGTSVGFSWSARLDRPDGTVIASGQTTLNIPLGSRVTQPVTFTTPASGSRVYLVLTTAKSGATTFSDAVEYFNLGSGSSGPVSGATYRIVNRNSGKPLGVAGGSSADGAKAVQQSGSGAWTVTSGQGGAYTLRYVPTGKVLDVNGSSTTQGLQLQQWTANGGTNQLWYLRSTGDGYYTIVSYSSGLLADVYGASTSDGAQVVQWTANGGTNQQWQLIPA